MSRAHVVIDLGFGDAGKGLLVDWLVREHDAGLVVRFNGGSQAGHNVVGPDGAHHTFSQFGAGSLVPGVQTFLSRHVVVHPLALRVEAEVLARVTGEAPLRRIFVSENARLITPFHQALNRLRELSRGDARHGSCGVGVGETVKHALEHPQEALHAGDLGRADVALRKLEEVRRRLLTEARTLGVVASEAAAKEWGVLEARVISELWLERASFLNAESLVVPDAWLTARMAQPGEVVFEGAQGVLLDEEFGFHPFTTWSRCTAANALELTGAAPVIKYGVLRCHAVRHGAGPLPTESAEVRPVSDHNERNLWQGSVRYGWFDGVLGRYALDAAGGVDVLAITHLDSVSGMSRWQGAASYGDGLRSLPLCASPSLAHQAELASLLSRVTPVYESVAAEESLVVERVEQLLGRGVDLVSRGPRASDVAAHPR